MSRVKTAQYTTPKTILVAPELAFTLPIKVANTGISAGADGRKVIYAGTPITGDFTNRATAFVKEDTKPNAVLLHEVDVTDGTENATAVIFGFIDESKLDNVTITSAQKEALSKITFVK